MTNAQYAAFLNAKAASDPLGLYNTNMGSDARGGITRTGVSGSYTYATKTNMDNKPVTLVSWYDSIRFANWLNNGQGSGDTETGAYTLLGGTATPSNGPSITRNAGATWFLPSQDEWYKAAYYQPAAHGGDTDNYWLYPTASNTAPKTAQADSVGNVSNPGANVANYGGGTIWNNVHGNFTTVGSAGPLSESYYGTSDQGGNVFEWVETLTGAGSHNVWGGNLATLETQLASTGGFSNLLAEDFMGQGFRVATIPEPSSLALAMLGFIGLAAWGWRRRSSRAS